MNTNMVFKKIRLIVLIIGGLLIIFFILAITLKWGEPLVEINWSQTQLCKKVNHEWVEVGSFSQEEDYYVCGFVESNKSNPEIRVHINIYKAGHELTIFPAFHGSYLVKNGENIVNINKNLRPGVYVIYISWGRETIDVIEMKITE